MARECWHQVELTGNSDVNEREFLHRLGEFLRSFMRADDKRKDILSKNLSQFGNKVVIPTVLKWYLNLHPPMKKYAEYIVSIDSFSQIGRDFVDQQLKFGAMMSLSSFPESAEFGQWFETFLKVNEATPLTDFTFTKDQLKTVTSHGENHTVGLVSSVSNELFRKMVIREAWTTYRSNACKFKLTNDQVCKCVVSVQRTRTEFEKEFDHLRTLETKQKDDEGVKKEGADDEAIPASDVRIDRVSSRPISRLSYNQLIDSLTQSKSKVSDDMNKPSQHDGCAPVCDCAPRCDAHLCVLPGYRCHECQDAPVYRARDNPDIHLTVLFTHTDKLMLTFIQPCSVFASRVCMPATAKSSFTIPDGCVVGLLTGTGSSAAEGVFGLNSTTVPHNWQPLTALTETLKVIQYEWDVTGMG